MDPKEIESMRKLSLKEAPFEVTGLPWLYKYGKYDRVPEEVLPKGMPDIFYEVARDTTGGIARIRTNSQKIYFKANVKMTKPYLYHMSQVGHSGFDFHVKYDNEELRFIHPTTTLVHDVTFCETEIAVRSNSLYDGSGSGAAREGLYYDLYIVLPIYNCVDEAFVYFDADADILPPTPLKYSKPVVFYGSSITQGACASRASTCYTNRIALELGTPIINFGFSGNARGEQWMADIIADRDMSVFVLDYDHNADTVEMLKNTHEAFYKTVRKKHPDTPVIFVTKPDYRFTLDDNDARREVIRGTYERAKAAGENVYFVDGKDFFGADRYYCLVDNCHPNDLGFDKMTKAIKPLVAKLLG
ncbi:MAG: hypothetical protein II748_00300 [Clostridia bacterium]|nr:hypothetical protein [Clostridia bacterium]